MSAPSLESDNHAAPAAVSTRVEGYLITLVTHYRVGASGHHPHVARSVAAALEFVLAQARDADSGTVGVTGVHTALLRAATAAATKAATIADRLHSVADQTTVALDTYRAAWAAATAQELRVIQRSLETEFAAES